MKLSSKGLKFWLLATLTAVFCVVVLPIAQARQSVNDQVGSLEAAISAHNLGSDSLTIAQADNPEVSIEFTNYTIEGSTAAELNQQMAELGPQGKDGKRFHGWTRWSVRWRYPFDTRNNQCVLYSPKVTVEVTFTMPEWEPPADAAPELVAEWQRYMEALQVHEDGHKDNGVNAAIDILALLEEMPAYSSCQELDAEANAAAKQVVQVYGEQDKEYDRLTSHGKTQGARFPLQPL